MPWKELGSIGKNPIVSKWFGTHTSGFITQNKPMYDLLPVKTQGPAKKYTACAMFICVQLRNTVKLVNQKIRHFPGLELRRTLNTEVRATFISYLLVSDPRFIANPTNLAYVTKLSRIVHFSQPKNPNKLFLTLEPSLATKNPSPCPNLILLP